VGVSTVCSCAAPNTAPPVSRGVGVHLGSAPTDAIPGLLRKHDSAGSNSSSSLRKYTCCGFGFVRDDRW
jgi:hypothetical protein